MAVPEIAVNKDGDPLLCKDKVGTPRKAGTASPSVDAVSFEKQDRPKFGRDVAPALDRRHYFGPFFGIYVIGHFKTRCPAASGFQRRTDPF
jgi:hypothetical protein